MARPKTAYYVVVAGRPYSRNDAAKWLVVLMLPSRAQQGSAVLERRGIDVWAEHVSNPDDVVANGQTAWKCLPR